MLEYSLEFYIEQQSLYKLMLGDLENYKSVYDKSLQQATYYAPF